MSQKYSRNLWLDRRACERELLGGYANTGPKTPLRLELIEIVEPSLKLRPLGNASSSGPGVAEVVNVRLPVPVTGSTVIEPTLVLSIVTGRSTGVTPSVGTFSTVIVSFCTTAPFSTT